MRATFGLLLLLGAVLGGCATTSIDYRQRMDALPEHYRQFDLVMGWETRVEDGQTAIDGVVRNVRYFVMRDLEIWVALLSPQGKPVRREVSFIIPSDLKLDESAPFSVRLPMAVKPGDRLRFTYKYRGSDGGDGLERGMAWMQSFERVVAPR
uniref:Lipoprotein, putative n=1 Tax=Geobacter sp. (strain M21) TaxID=443144 RepID=C6E3I0_GEOSM